MLGIDVGARRIGVAVSEGRVAVPLEIIEHTNRAADLARIIAIAEREGAAAIVVGLPLTAAGGDSEQTRLTRRFGAQLAGATSIPIAYHDERLSSRDVEDAARAAGATRRRQRHLDDAAAALILQRYIDAREVRA